MLAAVVAIFGWLHSVLMAPTWRRSDEQVETALRLRPLSTAPIREVVAVLVSSRSFGPCGLASMSPLRAMLPVDDLPPG